MKALSHGHKFLKLLSWVKESELFWIISFSVLTAVSAQISVPVQPVPFTLQTMIVLLSGAFLGARNGAYSQLLYLCLGAIGLPVFADGTMGFARLIGPTGGYLLAFPLGAFISGYFTGKTQKYLLVVISMFIAELAVILAGTLYLYASYLHNLDEAVKSGAAIFTVWMAVKVFASAAIYSGFKNNRQRRIK